MVSVTILSLGEAERYAVRRLVLAAERELLGRQPHFKMQISEVASATEIGRHASVLVLPTLLVNGKVVCSGRFPQKEEIVAWLEGALPG